MAKSRLEDILARSSSGLNRRDQRAGRKLLQEEKKRVLNMMAADELSGVGYPIDQQTRGLVTFANEDLARGVDPPLTNLWDVVSAFILREEREVLPLLRVRQEVDHAFDPDDFFAYASASSIRAAMIDQLYALKEGVIYNYSALGEMKQVLFENDQGEKAAISGLALVRYGDHLYWQTAGGFVTDLAAVTRERRELLKLDEARLRQVNAKASAEMIDDLLNPTAVSVPGSDDVWDCAAFGMFDLKRQSHQMRMSSRNWGVSQAVFSDQFESKYAELYQRDEAVRRMVDKSVLQIEADHLLFEIAETTFALPAYFAAKVQFVQKRDLKTDLGKSGTAKARFALKAPLDMRVLIRSVSTLDFSGHGPTSGRTYTPPRFKVEVEGFYRRLASGSKGHDAEGNPVVGKTWVKQHARWKDRPEKIGVIHIKASIGGAIERAHNSLQASNVRVVVPS